VSHTGQAAQEEWLMAKKKKDAGIAPPERSLRDEAEEQLARSPKISPDIANQTPEKLIHELQVHQLELETQAEDLRRAQFALEESRDKYLDLYEFAPLGYLTLNDKTRVTGANLTGAMLLGVERNTLVNHGFGRFIAPEDLDRWDRYFVSVRQQGEKQTCTLTLTRADGSRFPARLESTRLTVKSDGTTTIRVAISDITDIRQAEEALVESEERYRLLLQNAHDMIFVHEITGEGPGKFLEVNDKICITLGYTREELLAMNVRDIDVPEQNERIPAILKDLFTNHHVTFETEQFTKDGCRVPVEISAALFDVRGRPTVLAIVRDVTERKRAEEALRQANKQLNLLSSITRHDIKNQLMALNGYLELTREILGDPVKLEEYIIKEQNIANAIEDQITFTKDYQELGAAAPAWQSVNASIEKAIAGLPMHAVRVEVDPKNPAIFADRLFEKVFYNLIDNALRYGGAGMKTIRVSSQESDARLTILCEDDGVGITAEDKKRLFTRGFGHHTGLGLFLSREILSITGITIAENGTPGKGARFEIVVPNGMWRMVEADRKGD